MPQRVGFFGNFVPVRVGGSQWRPSRGIYFLAEQPPGGPVHAMIRNSNGSVSSLFIQLGQQLG